MIGQAPQDGSHLAAGFAGAHHVDVEVAKVLMVLLQCLAERHAAFDPFKHGLEHGLHGLFMAHFKQDFQGVVQR